ncbi:hypothetical protein EW145_g1632 [Phellinidium pouzarii]|uniref:RING-type domain-containing protein n=1 Tax=Phellinidium pouzarii TaxID=167371 RepID=A0A4S4LE18_9AGAM|nr:hypothetical protein EW145_g1632 [Phellinidium pouzarii]
MDDKELEVIRAARLQQLRQSGSVGQSSQDLPSGSTDPDAEAKRANEEQMRRDLLATVLDSDARQRLARIALVSPTRSTQIESILLRMAQSGQLRNRVGEKQLIELLEQAEDAQSKSGTKGTITFQRRRELEDDNDFDFDFQTGKRRLASSLIRSLTCSLFTDSFCSHTMSMSKLHPSLPAPVVHNSYIPSSQSKSHVLAGVQDAYWSDDEAEDAECPLCLEEMDVSDLNFKPCPCGYQICRFCWHHIKENLNRRCPACRREYSDESVEFKPINKEDHKRLTQQKKQRERERKELEALGRRHLLNVRVVQRNVVYVVGLGSRVAKEELIPTLRSNEFFGQYGKITKILLVKRTPPGGRSPIIGLYITYYRREDAARAISAVDGTPSPSGGGDVMRASHGTTKYCIAFLRGISCTNNGCMDFHEWGDEKDCFTKEDLTTLKHTMKDTESRQRIGKNPEDNNGLPRTAGWGQRPAVPNPTASSGASPVRATRRGHRSTRAAVGGESRPQAASSSRAQTQQDRKSSTTKTPSQASSSRSSTPAIATLPQRPITPVPALPNTKQQKTRRDSQNPLPPRSPTSSVAVESDLGSSEAISTSPAVSVPTVPPVSVRTPSAPPGLPAAPPGLTAHLSGLSESSTTPSPSSLTREGSASSYQISTQAQALLDDVRNRRESSVTSTFFSPFPDLDRTLQNLSGGDGESGGFNFNLDPKLAVDDDHFDATFAEFDGSSALSFGGGYFDPFSSERGDNLSSHFRPPLGLTYASNLPRAFYETFRPLAVEETSLASSGYTGSFNPFSESTEVATQPPAQRISLSQDDDSSRRMSRFGFARERQGSIGLSISATSSPLLSANTSLSSLSLSENPNPSSAASSHTPWPFQRHHDFGPPPGLGLPARVNTPSSARGSPLVPHAHAQTLPQSMQPSYVPQSSRFQPFDVGLSDTSLKDMFGIGRDRFMSRAMASDNNLHAMRPPSGTPFHDPAIMSSLPYTPSPSNDSGLGSMMAENGYSPQPPFSRPPGLSFQQSLQTVAQSTPSLFGQLNNLHMSSPVVTQAQGHIQGSEPLASVSVPPILAMPLGPVREPSPELSPMLSAADFPALPTASTGSDSHLQARAMQATQQPHILGSAVKDEKEQAKIDRKAAKKAVAVERASERERIAKEKAAEKERITHEKAEEKERIAKEKAEEKERTAKQKAEKERVMKEKAERDAEKEKVEKEKMEREKMAVQRKNDAEKTAKNKAIASSAKAIVSRSSTNKAASVAAEPVSPLPILSKMPRKNKPTTKPIRIPREDDSLHEPQSTVSPAITANSETPQPPPTKLPNVSEVVHSTPDTEASMSNTSRSANIGNPSMRPRSVAELLKEIDLEKGQYYLDNHPFFDLTKINPAAKMSLDYGTMARALSAFPVGGGSFADNASTRLNDKTVASFQQLLETLTQTMSDLVQLLPQTTWGSIFDILSQDLKDLKREYSLRSSTSFDGLVHDDLPEDADDEDEFYLDPPTPTMDKRAKWMEIQLAKLEELHRDVNAAAARAILASNDRGWDAHGFLPHLGNTLGRFEQSGLVEENGQKRPMTLDELEKKLVVAKEVAVFAETEMRESMEAMQALKP